MRSFLLALALVLCAPPAARSADSDADGVDDLVDNCPAVANPRVSLSWPHQTTLGGQLDDDLDGIGNACDCDFTGDGACGIVDFQAFLSDFVTTQPSPGLGTDMNGDGFVGIDDFGLFVAGFQQGSPGPSCGPACGGLRLGCSGAACPPGPNPACADAVAALCSDQDLVAADDLLAACLSGLDLEDPGMPPLGSGSTYGLAAAFRGLTSAVRPVFDQPTDSDPGTIDRLSEVLDALGFPWAGRDPLMWDAHRGEGPAAGFPLGTCVVPSGALDAEEIATAIETDVIPTLDQALAELEALAILQPIWNGSCQVPTDLGATRTVEFDETDALVLRATLHFVRGHLLFWLSHDWAADLELACQTLEAGPLGGIEQLLQDHPALLTHIDGGARALEARDDFLTSIGLTKQALDSALAELDAQDDDFLSVAFDTPEAEQALRDRLQRIEDSLLGPTYFPHLGLCGDPLLDAGAFFETPVRDPLPSFIGNRLQENTFPDPTFGGTLTPFTQEDLLCSIEEEPPVVQITTATGWPGGFTYFDVEVRMEDQPIGAASGIDVDTVQVWLYNGGFCYLEVNGIATGWISNITRHLVRTTESDGSVVLTGRVEAPLDHLFCSFTLSAGAFDNNGNPGSASERFQVVPMGGFLFTVQPPERAPAYGVPLDVSLQIIADPNSPFDPDDRRIFFMASYCSDATINGMPAPVGFFAEDVTGLLTEDGAPDDEIRTVSASLDATQAPMPALQCSPSFCVDIHGQDGDAFECRGWRIAE